MNTIETLKFLLDKALAETPPESRLVGLNVPIEIVQEIIDGQSEKRTDKHTKTHACDSVSRQAAIDLVRNCSVKEVTPVYMLIDKAEVMTELMMLSPAQPEQFWETCFDCPLSHGCPKIKGCTNEQAEQYAGEIPIDCPLDKESAQPEIIRCKDCKYCEYWYADKGRCFLWHEDGIDVFEDGYCNYAERRTDD